MAVDTNGSARRFKLVAENELDELVASALVTVDSAIPEADAMFAGDAKHYLEVGASALRSVLHALRGTGRGAPRRILDFGCGYGRVLRALRAAFPSAELVACDLDAGGVAYCASAFGAVPMNGAIDVKDLARVEGIDVVWCGSVLTHLNAPKWDPTLRYLAGTLAPGGVALLTTHGRRTARLMADPRYDYERYWLDDAARARILAAYRASGFGYENYADQDGYGVSLSSPSWVMAQALAVPGLRMTGYEEAGWDRHQDLVVLVKDAVQVIESRK